MYEGLTRFELWEIFYMARNAASNDLSFLVTILFGFLAVSFFAAKRLSKFQLITISAIYSGSYLYSSISFSTAFNTTFKVMGILAGVAVPAWIINGFYGLLFIAWIISIIFIVQARSEKDS